MEEHSKFLRLNINDVVRGLITAIFTAVIVTLYGAVNQAGFDIFTADWGVIASTALSAGFSAFIGYLGKNVMTAENGKVFGKI